MSKQVVVEIHPVKQVWPSVVVTIDQDAVRAYPDDPSEDAALVQQQVGWKAIGDQQINSAIAIDVASADEGCTKQFRSRNGA